MAADGVEIDKNENEDGEDMKVLDIIFQENWTQNRKRRSIKYKDSLFVILCL